MTSQSQAMMSQSHNATVSQGQPIMSHQASQQQQQFQQQQLQQQQVIQESAQTFRMCMYLACFGVYGRVSKVVAKHDDLLK